MLKNFFFKLSVNCLLRYNCFCWEIASGGSTVLQRLQFYTCIPATTLSAFHQSSCVTFCDIFKAEYYSSTDL